MKWTEKEMQKKFQTENNTEIESDRVNVELFKT